MALVGVPRVVPNGKVYRQIFDDEINLVRALGEARSKMAQHKFPPNPGGIPLVKDLETCTGNGFLSNRQQTWVEGMPNDDFTENPVLYKEAATLAYQKMQESDNVMAAREVRGLPEVIIPEKKNSNVIERISESRKCRHEEAVTNLRQELARIGKEMELCILEPGKLLLTKLMESDQTIENLFQRAESDVSLDTYTIQSFQEVWELLSQETFQRRQWIRELDRALCMAEVTRVELIKELLKKYTKLLEDIAYSLSSDIHRFIHSEAMMINQALLANRRAIARLFINLMEVDLRREVFQRRKLEERIKAWKTVQKELIIRSFREFMESERIQSPGIVKNELENMLNDQLSLNEKRRQLLYSLGNLLPLTHSKAEINEWYESVVALNKRIDTHNVQYMMRMRLQYERVCQECLSKVQESKKKLLEMKVCTEEEAEKIVNPSFFQLVGKVQSRFEHEMEVMDNDFEQLIRHTEINCKHLYQYFQDALVLLDIHQNNLSTQENDLHNKLNDCRNKHENLNKLREVNLDIALDKLRTLNVDEKLKVQLEKVYAILDTIRIGYEAFHQDLLAKVIAYPEFILNALISYSASVSRYFNVKEIFKGGPIKKAEIGSEDQEETTEDEDDTEDAEEAPESSVEQESVGDDLQDESLEEKSESVTGADERESTEKSRDVVSSAQDSDRTGFMGGPENFGLECFEADKYEEGSTLTPDSREVPEVEDKAAPLMVRFSDTPPMPSVVVLEDFTTSSGNTYTVVEKKGKTKIKKSERFYSGKLKANLLPSYLELVFLSHRFFEDLRRQIRLQFFEHLEKWFGQSLSNAWIIVAAKKEELNSELQLRIHLHEPRRERVEKDVYHVRLAELHLHNERLARHCAGVVEALNKEKDSFRKLQESQNDTSKSFLHKIHDMEKIFLTESRAEKLVSLSNNLHTELLNHVEVMQVSMRSYRQYLEAALAKLRDTNTDFLKACRLFSNGGNFSPEELDQFVKRLQKETGRIDFVEGLIMIDMEKMESNYLEQATDVIAKFENRFHYLAIDRVFMEKIQRFLTNIQVKIKSEVAKSNLQTQTLNAYLEKLVSRIDACARPNVDKESISSEELYEFSKFVMGELEQRSKYLNCLLLQDSMVHLPDVTVPGSIVASIPSDPSLQESKAFVMGVECTPLLVPSRMGKPAFDDAAISVIKHIVGIQRPRRGTDTQQEVDEPSKPVAGGGTTGKEISGVVFCPLSGASIIPTVPGFPLLNLRGESGQGPSGQTTVTAKRSSSVGKGTTLGSYSHFKGIAFNLVWDSFDVLMSVAEEFYKKDKHQITRPEYLQDTYDQCIDVMGQRLLLYLKQMDDYHIACISEFRDQLTRFEELLPLITQLVIGKHLKDHEQLLLDSTNQIRHDLQEQVHKWDAEKNKNKNKLRPSLGHPDNLPKLAALCQEEQERQKEQAEGICLCTKKLEACTIKCAQSFVFSLAACTERILMELDDCLTIDDVQVGKIEVPREKTSTLLRRKRAGLSLEVEECKLVAERGSRTWLGIPTTTLASCPNQVICQETASVTTAKTTLGHVAAVEERDAVYLKFKQVLEAEFARIEEENSSHLMKAQLWADWWKKSVQKIKQLYE